MSLSSEQAGLPAVGPAVDYRFDFYTGVPWTDDAVREYVQELGAKKTEVRAPR